MFCKYCGNQYPDDGVCNCAESVAARAAAAAPVATATAPAPANNAVGDAFKAMPNTFKTLLGNTSGAGISLASAVILAVGGLLLNILAWICMAGSIMGSLKDSLGAMGSIAWSYISKAFSGIYGYAVLGGLWTCIIPIALFMAIVIVGQLIRKEKVDIVPAFVAGVSVNTVPAALFLVGGLFTLLIPVVGVLITLIGIIFAMAGFYKQMAKLVANTDGIVGGIIAAAVVAVVIGLMAWIISGVFTGWIESVAGGILGDAAGLIGGLGGLSDLSGLGSLGF